MSFEAGPAQHTSCSREIPERMEDRLIVALDVPSIAEARRLVDTLDGVVSFFSAIGSSSALALTGFSII